MSLFDRIFNATLGRLIDIRIRQHRLFAKTIFGDPRRVSIAETALVNNATFNTHSGKIVVGEHAFFGQNVSLLAGTHDLAAPRESRKTTIPAEGCDITIESGAWLATNVTVIGPCVIGEMAVVAAGAVVVNDVKPYTIVAGVPAVVIGRVPQPLTPESEAPEDQPYPSTFAVMRRRR